MRRQFIIALVLLMNAFTAFGQDTAKINLWKRQLLTSKQDTARVNLLQELAWYTIDFDVTGGQQYAYEGLRLAKKLNYTKGIMQTTLRLGNAYLTQTNFDSAVYYFNLSLNAAKKLNDITGQGDACNGLSWAYSELKQDYAKALQCNLDALKLGEEHNNKKVLAKANSGIAVSYAYAENFPEAVKYMKRAVELFLELHDTVNYANNLGNLAQIYTMSNQPDSAIELYNKALIILKSWNDFNRLSYVYLYYGKLLTSTGKYSQALSKFDSAIFYSRKVNETRFIAEAYGEKGKAYQLMKEYAASIRNLDSSYKVAEAIKSQELQAQASELFADNYSAMNDFKNANEWLRRLIALNDSINAKETQQALLKFQTQFESEKKEKENRLLKAENDITSAKLQRNRTAMIGFAVLLLLLSFLTWLIYKNRQTKIRNIRALEQLNDKLEKQKEEISRINTVLELKALRAQMNPHFIFNCMSSIQECMLTGRLDDANTYLSKLSKLLRMVLNHSDDESVSLDVELEMLRLYLELETVRLKDGFLYEIEVDKEIFPEEMKVPTLILQPFAENAIWHGLLNKPADRQLKIHIETNHDTLSCMVEDNGIGRVKAAELNSSRNRHQSKGMELVKKRLEILREKSQQPKTGFVIKDLYGEDHESKGTIVEIILPIVSS
ncbi:MAG TPA: tetratricopeptide repeat protein [Chitinophagales bacterium]|nr:tetratricopeptide repeat protein [Chitinophagales bacterium]